MKNRVSRLYPVSEYEKLFTEEHGDSPEEEIEKLRNRNTSKYRTKTIKSGPILEVEAYPLLNNPVGKRRRRKNESKPAQKRLNDKNTVKKITRILHSNFTNKDLWTTWTYSNENLPADPEQAKKDITNFIRRQKHWLKKQPQYKNYELKYIYVTEFNDKEGRKTRIHHHMISNFPDRDVMEDLWNGGGRVNTRRLQPDDYGFEGLARYILKEPANENNKRYSMSRNMKKPKITVADNKMTRKRAERLATEEVMAQEVFEKMYQGYQFNDIEIKFSEFTSGAYIYVRMKRIEPISNTRKRE